MMTTLKSTAAALALLLNATAFAANVPLICLWEPAPGKKQSYIVEYDQAQQTVLFNGAPAGEANIDATTVRFNLHFHINTKEGSSKEVVWSHTIQRADGSMQVTNSDDKNLRGMQCGRLVFSDL